MSDDTEGVTDWSVYLSEDPPVVVKCSRCDHNLPHENKWGFTYAWCKVCLKRHKPQHVKTYSYRREGEELPEGKSLNEFLSAGKDTS